MDIPYLVTVLSSEEDGKVIEIKGGKTRYRGHKPVGTPKGMSHWSVYCCGTK